MLRLIALVLIVLWLLGFWLFMQAPVSATSCWS